MAIIYTYPTLSSASSADLILLTKASTKATSQITVDNLKDSLGVIDTITATSPIQVSLGNHSAALSLTTVPTNLGGTGSSDVNTGLNNLLPSQSGNSGKVLSTDGTNTSWVIDDTTSAGGINGSIQYNNGGNFLGSNRFLYSENVGENLLEIKGVSDLITGRYRSAKIKLEGTTGGPGGVPGAAGGEIELYSGGLNVTPTSVTIAAPRNPISNSYSIELPTDRPTSNNRILESNSIGVLSWIDTPTSVTPDGADTQMQYNNGGSFGGTTGLTWDDSTNILSIATRYEGDINGAVLQQVKAAEALSKGDVVYISGGTGDNPEVMKAQANSPTTMAALGIMKENLALNAIGECVTSGEITGLNLTSFVTGDELFVSDTTAGGLISTAPTGEANPIQKIGKVIKGGNGGALTVLGAFRTNATPNLNQGSLFIGNASNQTSTLGIGANDTVLKSNGTTASWVDSLYHEQGTFSPTISTATGTYTGGFTNNTTYTVVGDIVTVFWHVDFNATGGAGSITFTLPVNAETSTTAVGSFFPMKNTLKPNGENNIVGMKVSASIATLLDFSDVNFKLDATAGSPVINSGQLIIGTLTYRKA